jgi:THO complex subunit 2
MGKEGIGSKSYQQSLAEERSSFYSRRLLKRLQKENVRQTGRQLAIETHSNAMVAYTIVIDQIQNYDSLIPYIVDALKYSTALARDVMAFCLVKQLQKNSEKLKRDATYTPWFTALAKFTGAFYRKYYTTEIKGLLHLILQTLSQGHSYDLLLLKELLSRMGGCDSILDISDAAVESISGGKVLKGEVTVSFEAPAKKAQTLLRDELLDSKTAIPILLFMAKIRSKIIYDTDTTELKLISTLSDTCQDLLIQFSDFLLGSTLSSKAMETISSIMPSLSTLIDEIGLALPVAFQLVRSLMRQAFSYGENVKSAPGYLRKWHPFNPEIVSVVKKRMPEETWSIISEESFIIFWTINLQDIVIPTVKYESENKRLRDKYAEIDKSLSL